MLIFQYARILRSANAYHKPLLQMIKLRNGPAQNRLSKIDRQFSVARCYFEKHKTNTPKKPPPPSSTEYNSYGEVADPTAKQADPLAHLKKQQPAATPQLPPPPYPIIPKPQPNIAFGKEPAAPYTMTSTDPLKFPEEFDAQTGETQVKEGISDVREKKFKWLSNPEAVRHFRGELPLTGTATFAPQTPVWSYDDLNNIKLTHKKPETTSDKIAYSLVKGVRYACDLLSGYRFQEERTEQLWLDRLCYLETVSGVPSVVGAVVNHIHSLRTTRRDHGWIHHSIAEAQNERMHLITAIQMKQPGMFYRAFLIFGQAALVPLFLAIFLVHPRMGHRFVGYLQEETVITYSKLLQDMDAGGPMEKLGQSKAPEIAVDYWHLKANSTVKDVILSIRADDAYHRVINHTLGSMESTDYNPYRTTEKKKDN